MLPYLIAAGLAVSVAAHPTIRADVQDTTFCDPYNVTPDVWEAHDMDDFMNELAIKNMIDTFKNNKTQSVMEIWESQLGTKWTRSVWDCKDDGDGCDYHSLSQFCKDHPRWTLAVGAVSNYVQFLQNLENRITQTTQPLGNLIPNFPSTFAPDNATLSAGMSSGQSIASGGLGIALSLFGLLPGLDLLEDGVKAGLGAATAMGGLANSALGAAGLHGGTPSDVEVKFDSWATTAAQLGNFQQQMINGIGAQLDALFVPGKIGKEEDIMFIHEQLMRGAFAGASYPTIPLKGTSDGLTAVLASQAITTLWQWDGVVAVRLNKADIAGWGFDLDPCDGDTLFKEGSEKFCDKDGNMMVFQKPSSDPRYRPLLDPSKYTVSGLDHLSDYKLSPEIMLTAAWNNQKAYGPGASGPTPDALAKNIINDATANVPLETLVFSNFLVCDYADIPQPPAWQEEKFQSDCNAQRGDNYKYCVFYGLMSLCHNNPIFNKDGDNAIKWPYRDDDIGL